MALESGPSPPLHIACKHGHLKTVQLLIKALGVPVDASDHWGNTPLHWAADGRHIEVAKWLVESQGAAADARNNEGEQPIHKASAKCCLTVVKWLVDDCGVSPDATCDSDLFNQPIHVACCNGDLSLVRWLVNFKQVKLDAADNGGHTPLDYAIQSGKLDIVKLLVDKASESSCWLDPFSLLSHPDLRST